MSFPAPTQIVAETVPVAAMGSVDLVGLLRRQLLAGRRRPVIVSGRSSIAFLAIARLSTLEWRRHAEAVYRREVTAH